MNRLFWLALVGVCLLGLSGRLSAAEVETVTIGSVALTPCKVEGSDDEVLCGTYEVWEDRDRAAGRKIKLNFVVARANVENPKPDPIFFFSGGPGTGAAAEAGYLIGGFSEGGRERDLVFVDQRGTGASNGLFCEVSGDPNSVQTWLSPMFPADYVTACRKMLEVNADLALYSSWLAVDDIDEIRAALGYGKINLFGGSYGGRMVLEFMRRHPENVRAAVPMVPAPPEQVIPTSFARDAQAAMDAVINDCLADESCNKAFPNLGDKLKKILAEVKAGPIEVEVNNAWTSKKEKVSLPYGPFVAGLRALLYDPQRAAALPKMIDEAAKGNYEPITLYTAGYEKMLSEFIAEGMYLSVTCSEDLPYLDMEAAKKESANTFLGNYRIDAQSQACKLWVRGKIEPEFHEPFHSQVPALFITGEDDPVTPPYWSQRVVKNMPNSKLIIIPNTSHGMSNAGSCFFPLIVQFLETGSVAGLDDSCARDVKRPAWVLDQETFEKFYR